MKRKRTRRPRPDRAARVRLAIDAVRASTPRRPTIKTSIAALDILIAALR